MYVEREIAFQLKDAGAEGILTLKEILPRIQAVQSQLSLKRILLTTLTDSIRETAPEQCGISGDCPVYPYGEVLERGKTHAPPSVVVDPEETALLQYTGGTTGVSKGAMLTHRNLVSDVVQCVAWNVDAVRGKERMLATIPFFHVYGMTVAMNEALYLAATIILLPRFNVDELLEAINKIWSTAAWALRQTFTGSGTGVVSVAFSPNGQELVSGGLDGRLKLWDLSGACLRTIAAHALPVTATVFSTDGVQIVSGSDDNTIRVWSAADGAAVCTLGGQHGYVGVVAVSPDGMLCASAGGEQSIQVRNTSDGSLVITLPGNTNYISSLSFSPDSTTLASGGGPLDPTIKLWRIRGYQTKVKIHTVSRRRNIFASKDEIYTIPGGGL